MTPRESFDDELFQLERRIARRADELSRQLGVDRGQALEHWRQAEREVWENAVADFIGESESLCDHRPGFAKNQEFTVT
jgi:hypothetical protein